LVWRRLLAALQTERGGRDSNASDEDGRKDSDFERFTPSSALGDVTNKRDSRPFDARSRPFVHRGTKPSLEEIEDAIVLAVLDERGEVADELVRVLRSRRDSPAGKLATRAMTNHRR
jgi:hypothetical protein